MQNLTSQDFSIDILTVLLLSALKGTSDSSVNKAGTCKFHPLVHFPPLRVPLPGRSEVSRKARIYGASAMPVGYSVSASRSPDV